MKEAGHRELPDRRGSRDSDDDHHEESKYRNHIKSNLAAVDYYPTPIFDNDTTGDDTAKEFAKQCLLPFFADDLQRLTNMVRPTLRAVLRLVEIAGARTQDIRIMVVAGFPVHRGRELLRQCGFSEVNIQRLLVFDGA
ncbi:unnamed protein product [Penicillium palitans]